MRNLRRSVRSNPSKAVNELRARLSKLSKPCWPEFMSDRKMPAFFLFRRSRTPFVAVLLSFALSGCPMPIPVCENWDFVKPGIGVKNLAPVHKAVPKGSALVFGRVNLRPLDEQGVISARLVRYKRLHLSVETPYAEEEVWLKPGGSFQWILPEGRYVIQPFYYHHAYEGATYQANDEVYVSVEFAVSDNSAAIYLGLLDIEITPEYKIQAVTIKDDKQTARVAFPTRSFANGLPIEAQLMQHNPEPIFLDVQQRRVCRRRNICWGIITPYFSDCFNADKI